MATLLAPYNSAMHLGCGFNSFNQQLCIDHAVESDPELAAKKKDATVADTKHVSQEVYYSTRVIDKVTDVTDAMKIKAGFAVKYDSLNVAGNGSFDNTNKIKTSDVTIMVHCKVVNQVVYDHSLVHFKPISGLKDLSPARMAEVYGDCFISGFQEGGEFMATISITAKNRTEARDIKAKAKIEYTKAKPVVPEIKESDAEATKKKKEFEGQLALDNFVKNSKSIADENEVSISVTWTGGGQHLKPPEKDWDFPTMKEAALKFPDLVAKTPIRTHALLTKYTALRSFYAVNYFNVPAYEKTTTYTNILQEAYLDYKSILSNLQVLAYEVSEGSKRLIPNPRAIKSGSANTKVANAASTIPSKDQSLDEKHSESTDDESLTDINKTTPQSSIDERSEAQQIVLFNDLKVGSAFPATIEGLEEARSIARHMINRIIQEIDNVAIKPEIATDEKHVLPFMSPFLFKKYLPIGEAVPLMATKAEQAQTAAEEETGKLSNILSLP